MTTGLIELNHIGFLSKALGLPRLLRFAFVADTPSGRAIYTTDGFRLHMVTGVDLEDGIYAIAGDVIAKTNIESNLPWSPVVEESFGCNIELNLVGRCRNDDGDEFAVFNDCIIGAIFWDDILDFCKNPKVFASSRRATPVRIEMGENRLAVVMPFSTDAMLNTGK